MEESSVSGLQARLAVAIAALERAEERALAGVLALEVMHEVKNPLEALAHLVYLAHEDAADSEKVVTYMRQAQEQILQLNHVAGQTLGFAKTTQAAKPIDLVALAEAALRIHRRTIEAKQVHLVRDLPGAVIAEVHTGEMLQVLSNLVVNALDALPPQGTLVLRIKKRRGRVQLLIADNGHGIAPVHYPEIFQPFFTTKRDRGTGLGLALSKKIVERHRGKISMKSSVREGRTGTIFKVSLPG